MYFYNGIFFHKPPYTEKSTFPQYDSFPEYHPVDVMRYAGQEDQNKVDMFEKDILKFIKDNDTDHGFYFPVGSLVVVDWIDDGFWLVPVDKWEEIVESRKRGGGICDKCASWRGLYSENHEISVGFFTEIVGNTCQNPELLKALTTAAPDEPAPAALSMDLMKRAYAQVEANVEDPEDQWLSIRVSQETFYWMLSRGFIDADGYMLDTVDRRDIIIEQSRELCRKFINKVEFGRARSIETYAECKELLSAIEGAQNMPEPK